VDPRDHLGIDRGHPLAFRLLDDDVGDDELRLVGTVARARTRRQAPQQHGRGLQGRLVASQLALQALEVVRGEQVEVPVDDPHREPACRMLVRVEREQLQPQALGDRARGHARRVERLHVAQRHQHLVVVRGRIERAQRGELVERLRQVPRRVDRLDHRVHEHAVAIGQAQAPRLLQQVLAQRRRARHHQRRVPLVVAAAARAVVRRAAAPQLVEPVGGDRGLVGRGVGRLLGRLRRVGGAGLLGLHRLEEGVGRQDFLDLLLELQRGQLQQLDRALQERGHRQLVAGAQLQRNGHRCASWSVVVAPVVVARSPRSARAVPSPAIPRRCVGRGRRGGIFSRVRPLGTEISADRSHPRPSRGGHPTCRDPGAGRPRPTRARRDATVSPSSSG